MISKSKNISLWWILAVSLMLAVLIAATLTAKHIRHQTRQSLLESGRASALTVSIYILSEIKKIEGSAKALAASLSILPALISKDERAIADANRALDRYQEAFEVSAAYLMDRDGKTLASSNRHASDSFVGKTYAFRPYFKDALQGRLSRYFALGVTSGRRGFYAGFPVIDDLGVQAGVVTIKMELDGLEELFQNYANCFLVAPEGVIFLSSRSDLVLKSLSPLDETTQQSLLDSRQFGNQPFQAVFPTATADGMRVTLEGATYLVASTLIGLDGWSVVTFTPDALVDTYTYIVAITAVSICMVLLIFFGVIDAINRSRKSIRQNEARLRQLTDATFEGLLIHRQGKILDVNQAFLRMLGYSRSEILGRNIFDFMTPPSADLVAHNIQTGYDQPLEVAMVTKAGYLLTAEVFGKPIDYKGIAARVVAFRDIRARKRMEAERESAIGMLRSISDVAQDAIMTMNPQGDIAFWNPAAERILGYQSQEVLGRNLHALLAPPHYHAAHEGALARFHKTGQGDAVGQTLELEAIRKDGRLIPIELSLSALQHEDGWHAVGIIRDITERKRLEEAIQEMATRDHLTALYNRRGFLALAEQQLKIADRSQAELTLFFIDMDGLKGINDTLGHEAGDAAIQETAAALKDSFRASDIIARMGGDEFVVLAIDSRDSRPETLISRLQSRIDRYNAQPDRQYKLAVSSGCARYTRAQPVPIDELIANADKLMYEQKTKKRATLSAHVEGGAVET